MVTRTQGEVSMLTRTQTELRLHGDQDKLSFVSMVTSAEVLTRYDALRVLSGRMCLCGQEVCSTPRSPAGSPPAAPSAPHSPPYPLPRTPAPPPLAITTPNHLDPPSSTPLLRAPPPSPPHPLRF